MIAVNLPTPLIEYTAGKRDVSGEGATLNGLLEDLDRQFSGIRFRMIDEQGKGRAHIKFFINGQLCRDLSAPLKPGDRLMIVAALSGG